MSTPTCRSCDAPLTTLFVDLGLSPISNAYPPDVTPRPIEGVYPLRAFVCDRCKLVQLADVATRETHFHEDYAYFSSYSSAWLDHSRLFAESAIARFGLGSSSRIVEVGSNDGYLLRNFVSRGIPAVGVDPAANAAAAAEAVGVRTTVGFFGRDLAAVVARDHGQADLIVANNVLAHVPDINDFVAGFAVVLAPRGTISVEFPHLIELIRKVEFDTIYHEHYSYLSLLALAPLFARHGLAAYDVERLPTHGGSLRLFVGHLSAGHEPTANLAGLIAEEAAAGLERIETYVSFGEDVRQRKDALLALVRPLKAGGARIAGYGAPAKATTLLNFCGLGAETLDFTADRNPAKQGRLIPGTGIPILRPEAIAERRPDYVMILPWNIRDEIAADLAYIGEWGGRFIVPVPEPRIEDPT